MAVIVRFIDPITDTLIADSYVFSAKIAYGLNRSGDFDLKLPRNSDAVEQIEEGSTVEIYLDSRLLMRGVVQQIDQAFDDKTTLNLGGRDSTDQAYLGGASPFAHYRSAPLLLMLTDVLSWAGWRIGEIDTLVNPTEIGTLDVRAETRALEQAQKIIDTFDGALYRYGGQHAGYHTLDIGIFGKRSQIAILTPPDDTRAINDATKVGWMKSFTVKTVLSEVLHAVTMYGGDFTDESTRKRTAYLGDGVDSSTERDAVIADPDIGYMEIIPWRSAVVWNRNLGDAIGINRISSYCIPTLDSGTTSVYPVGRIGVGAANNRKSVFTFFGVPGYLRRFIFKLNTNAGAPAAMTFNLWEVTETGFGGVNYDTLLYTTDLGVLASGTVIEVRIPAETARLDYGQQYAVQLELGGAYVDSVFYRIASNPTYGPTPSRLIYGITTGSADGFIANPTNGPSFDLYIDPDPGPAGNWITEKDSNARIQESSETLTLANIQALGAVLWGKAKGMLSRRQEQTIEYDLGGVFGEDILPEPGETVYVSGRAQAAYIDPFTGEARTFILQVQEDLRVDEIVINLNGDKTSYDLKVSTLLGVLPQDESIVIVDTATKNKEKKTDQDMVDRYPYTLVTEAVNITAVDPNAVNAEGLAVYQIALPYTTTPPAGTFQPFLLGIPFGTSLSGAVRVEWLTDLNHDTLTGPVCNLSIADREWRYSDTVDMTFYVGWR